MVMAQQTQEKLSRINELAQKAANELGLILLGVRMGQQGKNKSLEVSIYRKNPAISFNDCEQMSRSLEQLLEIEETGNSAFINNSYVLEVGSAGIDRQLTSAFEFNLFAGSKVRVTAKEKIASLGNEFIGVLLGGDENSVTLCQTIPLPNKLSKSQPKGVGKKRTANNISQTSDDKITLNLQQVYRIYLWPDTKEASKNAAE
jgi:ribosome maturation factor RimP